MNGFMCKSVFVCVNAGKKGGIVVGIVNNRKQLKRLRLFSMLCVYCSAAAVAVATFGVVVFLFNSLSVF